MNSSYLWERTCLNHMLHAISSGISSVLPSVPPPFMPFSLPVCCSAVHACCFPADTITTAVGDAKQEGQVDGPGASARLSSGAFSVSCMQGGSVSVADMSVNHVRLVKPSAPVTTRSQTIAAEGIGRSLASTAVEGTTGTAAEHGLSVREGDAYSIATVCTVPRGVGKYVIVDAQQQGVLYATNMRDNVVWKLDCNAGEQNLTQNLTQQVKYRYTVRVLVAYEARMADSLKQRQKRHVGFAPKTRLKVAKRWPEPRAAPKC